MTNLNEYRNIWVYIETECGKAKNVGFELLNAARPLAEQKGCELVAVVIGNSIESAARDAICYGADRAIIVDGPEYEYYSTVPLHPCRQSSGVHARRGHRHVQ